MAKKKQSSALKQNPLKSKVTAILIGFMGALAILGGVVVFVALPAMDEARQQAQEIESLETQQASLTSQVNSMRSYQQQVGEIAAYDATLSEEFPSLVEVNAMREGLYTLATNSNVFLNVTTTTPQVIDQDAQTGATTTDTAATDTAATDTAATDTAETPVVEDGAAADATDATGTATATEEAPDLGTIAQVDLQIAATGTYENLGRFLDDMYASYSRGFLITSFAVSGSTSEEEGVASTYTVTITASTYIYKESTLPEGALADQGTTTDDTVTDGDTTTAEASFTQPEFSMPVPEGYTAATTVPTSFEGVDLTAYDAIYSVMTNDTTGNSVLIVGQIPTSGDAATDVENYTNSQTTASSVSSAEFNGFAYSTVEGGTDGDMGLFEYNGMVVYLFTNGDIADINNVLSGIS